MTEPKRWLADSEGPEAARELLHALQAPTPPGLGKQSELVRKLATLRAAGVAPTSSLGAWLKLALVCSACIGVGAVLTTGFGTTAPHVIPANVLPRAPLPVLAPVPPGEARPDTAQPSGASPGDSAQRSPRALPAPVRQKATRRDALGEEEALLERARRLVSLEPRTALALLNKHRDQFPRGQLAAERMFLSVDVLERLGNMEAALAQATALTQRFPTSAYAVQLQGRVKPR